jgi:hypothetical protein
MNHLYPVVGTALYLNYPKKLRVNSDLLFCISVIHNFGLIVFSGWTCISLLYVIYDHGLVFQGNYYFQVEHFDKVIFYFYLSKKAPLRDTFGAPHFGINVARDKGQIDSPRYLFIV